LIDGTFKSVPRPYYQLVTIHAFIYGKAVPIFYALLSSKTENINKTLFEYVKNEGINIESVVVDLECALKNALEKVFPTLRVFYCNFHFGQCVWRRLQSLGLSGKYINDFHIAKIVRMYLNLAFFSFKIRLKCLQLH
jgi:hypothetical protein